MSIGTNITPHGIVASLLVGLCAVSVPIYPLGGANCASANARPSATRCCCQGKCSGHCRMVCCQRSAPPQDRAPAPNKLLDDSHVWGVVGLLADVVDPAANRSSRTERSHLELPPTVGGSLLDLGVRLNA